MFSHMGEGGGHILYMGEGGRGMFPCVGGGGGACSHRGLGEGRVYVWVFIN